MWLGSYAHESLRLAASRPPTGYAIIAEPSPCPSLRGNGLFLEGDGQEKFYECELNRQSPLNGNA
jgi:hypothetical protein